MTGEPAEQETPRIEFTGKSMSAREVRRWQRRFHLAHTLGDMRLLNEDGTTRKTWRGMRRGPKRAWVQVRLWFWAHAPRWFG